MSNEMTNEEKMLKSQEISIEINKLMNELGSDFSDIGDWKVNKIYEYRMLGKEDPYDIEELFRKRQEVRDKINLLQDELKKLEA